MVRAVIDTNVLLEGLTLRGTAGRVVDAWRLSAFLPCVSTSLALEYEEVLLRRFATWRHDEVQAALAALLDRAEYVEIRFRLRPVSPDPDDDFLLECAFNAGAILVSRNDRDLLDGCRTLQIPYLHPHAFLRQIEETEDQNG